MKIFLLCLWNILFIQPKNARTIRHFQQKIAGIAFAGKFYADSSRVHHFIYLKTQKAIIDLTDMETYLLKDTLPLVKQENKLVRNVIL